MATTIPVTDQDNGKEDNVNGKFNAIDQAATPIMMLSGMLHKKSRKHALIGAKWQQRWFEVTHDTLNYYKTTEEEISQSPSSSSPSSSSSSSSSSSTSPASTKIRRLKVGLDVSVQWENAWLPAKIIKVQSIAPKCDIIIVGSSLSNKIGMANKWLKNIHRNQLRTRNCSNNGGGSSEESRYLGMVVGNTDIKQRPRTGGTTTSSPTPQETPDLPPAPSLTPSSTLSSLSASSPPTVTTTNESSGKSTSHYRRNDAPTGREAPSCSASITCAVSSALPVLRGKSILKSIPLTSIVAVMSETSVDRPTEFAIALRQGRVLELRALTAEDAERWVSQLDARVRSASLDDEDVIPFAPAPQLPTSLPTSSSSLIPPRPQVEAKTDEQLARELQAQFDLEAASQSQNTTRSTGSTSRRNSGAGGSGGSTGGGTGCDRMHSLDNDASLLFRLSQGGSSPASTKR